MTAIESLPAYRKAEAEAERRGENLSSLIDAFLAGYARGASTNSLAATPQPGDTVLRDETDWPHATRRDAWGKRYEPDHRLLIRSQKRDLKRLYQASPGLCGRTARHAPRRGADPGTCARRLRPAHTGQSAGGIQWSSRVPLHGRCSRDLLSAHAARVPAHTAYLHPCRA